MSLAFICRNKSVGNSRPTLVYQWLDQGACLPETIFNLRENTIHGIPSKVEFDCEEEGLYRLDRTSSDPTLLNGADVVVMGKGFLPLFLHYPFSIDILIYVEIPKDGITRAKLATTTSLIYKRIYDIEAETSSQKHIGPICCKLKNRITTDGTFGIYGHSISDLVMLSLCYSKRLNALFMEF